MNDSQSKTAGSEVAKASILAEAAEIAMGGWHSVEKARAFACSVSDYLLAATQPNAAPTAEVVADALRAFVDIKPLGYGAIGTRDVDMAQWNEAHRAAKVCLEALATHAGAAAAEPVAWRYRIKGGEWDYEEMPFFAGGSPGPNEEHQALYAAPLSALTSAPAVPEATHSMEALELVRAVCAKHGFQSRQFAEDMIEALAPSKVAQRVGRLRATLDAIRLTYDDGELRERAADALREDDAAALKGVQPGEQDLDK